MPTIGRWNPLPFKIGGGPSDSEKFYNSLKSMVGVGGAAADETIEAEWRMAKARGLAAGSNEEKAAMQAWPDTATDHIDVYEAVLGLAVAPFESDERRRQRITLEWTKAVDAVSATIVAALQRIDSRFSAVMSDYETSTTTVHGRAFEDYDFSPDACGPAFDIGTKSTMWPNYSGGFIFHVLFDAGAGSATVGELALIEQAKSVLNEMLPAWIDYTILTSYSGFILDIDLLDLTGFGS